MAEVQPAQQQISRPKKKVASLDGFLACGGKKVSNTNEAHQSPPKASKPAAVVCDNSNVATAQKSKSTDNLPITPTRTSKSKSRSFKTNRELSQSAHPGTTTPSRDKNGRRKGIARAHSFDKHTIAKRMNSAATSTPTTNNATASNGTEKSNHNKKQQSPKPQMGRSKSFDADGMPLKRIPRNVPRGEPNRERPQRAQSMNEKHPSQRRLINGNGAAEKQPPRKKTDRLNEPPKRSSSHEKSDKIKQRRSRPGKRETKGKSTSPVRQPSITAETMAKAKAKAPAFPAEYPGQPDPTAAFKATFAAAAPPPKTDFLLTTAEENGKGEDSKDDDSDCEDANIYDNREGGIMQFDPTAMDNIVIVRQDSGIHSFPSCPVELDISLPDHSDQSGDNRALSSQEGHTGEENTSMWGKKSTLRGLMFPTKKNAAEEAAASEMTATATATSIFNTFKFTSSKPADQEEAGEPAPSLFNTFFGSGADSQPGHQQLLGDDETLDASYNYH